MFSIFISEYLNVHQFIRVLYKNTNLKLNALIMDITATLLSMKDICSQFPSRLSADILSISQQTDQTHLCYVLPEDCWITLPGTLKQWWLSVLERARWWSSKYREKSAPCCGKDQFSNCSVHSYVYDLFCMAYVEFPMLWMQVVFKQHHKNAAVSILIRGQFKET